MLLILGLLWCVYITVILLPMHQWSTILTTRSIQLLLTLSICSYLLWAYHWQHDISIADSTYYLTDWRIHLTLFTLLMSWSIFHSYKHMDNERLMMLLANVVGIESVIYSEDLLMTLLSWEIVNVTLYLIMGKEAISATLKYFILSAISTSLIIFSILLIYYQFGSVHYQDILWCHTLSDSNTSHIIALPLLLAIFLKLGISPFHLWVADVYQGLHPEKTLWLSTISKLCLLIILFNLHLYSVIPSSLSPLFLAAGSLSLFVGALGMLYQFHWIRLLAFSSVANMGYIIMSLGLNSIGYFYNALIYLLTTIALFSMFAQSAFLPAIYRHNTFLWCSLVLLLCSVAGLPPFAGFFGKLLILEPFLSYHLSTLLLFILATTVLALANYLSLLQSSSSSSSSIYSLSLSQSLSSPIPLSLSSPIIAIICLFLLSFLFGPQSLLLPFLSISL